MPLFGSKRSFISAARWVVVRLLFTSQADESVNAAPKPTIDWYVRPSSTPIVEAATDLVEVMVRFAWRVSLLAEPRSVSHTWTEDWLDVAAAGSGAAYQVNANTVARRA
jgi:hypothetical protein